MECLFKVLGNGNRREMLKLLKRGEMHVSGIARELGISVPVALKHVNKLEAAGLVVRRRAGNTHMLGVAQDRLEKLSGLWMLLDEPLVLETKRGSSLSDVLNNLPEIDVGKTSRGEYIRAVDGREGFFVYEINGRLTDKPINKCRIDQDSEVEIKRLLPALDKKIRIKVI